MPNRLRRLLARLLAVFRHDDLDDDFSEELKSHLEMLTDDNIRRGLDPVEARRQAAIRLGGATSLRVQHRDARGLPIVESFFQDLRFAVRLMLKDRWGSAAAIAAIALGIGANTVGFTIVNAAFIRGFSFDRADQLRMISWRPDRGRRVAASLIDFDDWRAQSQSFSDIAAFGSGAINISDDVTAPEQTQGARVTANHFAVLHEHPVIGRDFTTDDQRESDRVVIISDALWQRRFAGDRQVLGKTMRVNGVPSTIIGVMRPQMQFPDNSELWVPISPSGTALPRHVRGYGVVGRLKDGVRDTQAAAEIDAISKRIITKEPNETAGLVGGQVETLLERFLGGQARPMFVTVMGAVSFVLLIACANVANLLLSRAMARGQEVAVRYSLGATRGRIIRQLLIESIALSTLGGAIGMVLAVQGVHAFDAAVQMAQPPYWLHFTIDYRVLAYVAGTCLATGVLFGLAPALQVSRDGQHDTLKENGRSLAGNRRAGRLGQVLVVAELALTIVLLCGAGLMARSFVNLTTLDPGFRVDDLVRMRLQLPPAKYPTAESRGRFFDQLQPRVDAIPGIAGSAIATAVPPSGDERWRIEIEGDNLQNDRRPFVSTVSVSPTYFTVLGVTMNRGRAIDASDGAPGSDNVVISQVFAKRYFPDADPIGHRIKFVPRPSADEIAGDAEFAQRWRTIVGVSAPFLQGSTEEAFRSAIVYVPFREKLPRISSLLVRSALPPADVMAAIRAAVQSVDVDQPVFTVETLAHAIDNERLFHRIFSVVFALLAAIALILSAVGIYGVMAYAVAQRTQEIGVRMAIGAPRAHVSWLFLKRCLIQLAAALAIGLPGALGLGRLVSFNLVQITPNDPLTFGAITVIVIGVALVACLAPVRRASKVDPVVALRAE